MFRYFFRRFKAHFELDRRQAKIYFSLLWISLFVLCSPVFTYYAYPLLLPEKEFKVHVDTLLEERSESELSDSKSKKQIEQKHISNFSEEEWCAMGVPVYLAKRILKFQQKGAVLRNCKDLSKVYGMTNELLEKVSPYVIDEKVVRQTYKKQEYNIKAESNRNLVTIDINTADSLSLIELPGIGPVFAKRIIQYRKLLQGYVTKEQYKEIYGLSDFALNVLNERTIIKFEGLAPLHECDHKKLNEHLYLSSKDARYVLGQLSATKNLCWNDFAIGLSEKALTHLTELQLYYPCGE